MAHQFSINANTAPPYQALPLRALPDRRPADFSADMKFTGFIANALQHHGYCRGELAVMRTVSAGFAGRRVQHV